MLLFVLHIQVFTLHDTVRRHSAHDLVYRTVLVDIHACRQFGHIRRGFGCRVLLIDRPQSHIFRRKTLRPREQQVSIRDMVCLQKLLRAPCFELPRGDVRQARKRHSCPCSRFRQGRIDLIAVHERDGARCRLCIFDHILLDMQGVRRSYQRDRQFLHALQGFGEQGYRMIGVFVISTYPLLESAALGCYGLAVGDHRKIPCSGRLIRLDIHLDALDGHTCHIREGDLRRIPGSHVPFLVRTGIRDLHVLRIRILACHLAFAGDEPGHDSR